MGAVQVVGNVHGGGEDYGGGGGCGGGDEGEGCCLHEPGYCEIRRHKTKLKSSPCLDAKTVVPAVNAANAGAADGAAAAASDYGEADAAARDGSVVAGAMVCFLE